MCLVLRFSMTYYCTFNRLFLGHSLPNRSGQFCLCQEQQQQQQAHTQPPPHLRSICWQHFLSQPTVGIFFLDVAPFKYTIMQFSATRSSRVPITYLTKATGQRSNTRLKGAPPNFLFTRDREKINTLFFFYSLKYIVHDVSVIWLIALRHETHGEHNDGIQTIAVVALRGRGKPQSQHTAPLVLEEPTALPVYQGRTLIHSSYQGNARQAYLWRNIQNTRPFMVRDTGKEKV